MAIVRSVFGHVADLAWPPMCAGCGERGAWVCASCRETVPMLTPPWCSRCGDDPCRCASLPVELTVVRSAGPHVGWLRDSVHALKYQGESARAEPLGALIAPLLDELLAVESGAVIVPVTLHRSRRRERGYNQCLLLARSAVRRSATRKARLAEQALTRTRPTRQQVGLAPGERIGNVAGAFVADARLVTGRPVILVDDVLTTGSTLAACAIALRAAGATDVAAVTVSRARSAVHPDDGG